MKFVGIAGEKGLFRYAPEPLLPRNIPPANTLLRAYFYSAPLAWFYSALDGRRFCPDRASSEPVLTIPFHPRRRSGFRAGKSSGIGSPLPQAFPSDAADMNAAAGAPCSLVGNRSDRVEAGDSAAEHHISDVGAGDEEDKSHRGRHQEEVAENHP